MQGIIQEALVYSERGWIEFLPALPEEWKQGSVDGLMARTRVCIRRLAWDLEKKILEAELEAYEDRGGQNFLPGIAIRCMLLSKTGRTAQDLDLIHRILELPAVFIGSDAVMLSKRLGEMLGCGVIQFLRNLRDAQAFVCQIDFCRRHSGFLFFC